MKKVLRLIIGLIILLNCAVTFAEEEISEDEKIQRGIKIVSENLQKKFPASIDARIIGNDATPEFILRYKDISADYIRRSDNHYIKFNVDREIIYMMGTRAAWNYGVTGIKNDNENFSVAPTIGIALEMAIQPKVAVYTNISGIVMGGYGHICDFEGGFKYFPEKNFAWTIGWRHIDSRINWNKNHGEFKLSGFFTGFRADF